MKKRAILGLILTLSLTLGGTTYAFGEDNEAIIAPEVKMLRNGSITPDSYRLGVDNFVTGFFGDKNIRKIELHVNGIKKSEGTIFAQDKVFEIPAEEFILNLEDKVEVVGVNKQGRELDRQIVSVEKATILLTAEGYSLHDDQIIGLAGNQIDTVTLIVEGDVIRSVGVENQAYVMSVEEDEIFYTDDLVEIVGSVNGKEVARVNVAVSPFDLDASIQNFSLGVDKNIKGVFSGKGFGKIKQARLVINNKKFTTVDINADGTFEIKADNYILSLKDNVKIAVLDENGKELGRYQVAIVTENNEEKPIFEWFPDTAMAKRIASILNKAVTDSVGIKDLQTIELIRIASDDYGLRSIAGIEYLSNLRSLMINSDTFDGNIDELKDLVNLNYLYVDKPVKDVISLSNLVNLRKLQVFTSESKNDLKFVKNMKNLEMLSTTGVFTDLNDLQELTKLKELLLTGIELRDITALNYLVNLKKLTIFGGSFRNANPLRNLKNLNELELVGTSLSDISGLELLVGLKKVDLYSNQIKDISVFEKLPNIESLYLSRNQITDISPLRNYKGNAIISDQEIKYPHQKLVNGTLTVKHNIINSDQSLIIPIVPSGSYGECEITWKGLSNTGTVDYRFSGNTYQYSGCVTIPYID